MKRQILVISGPTGSGESTITKIILKKYQNFRRLVTATTRPPRLNEKNGVDYYFFSKEKFLEENSRGNILEYTYVENRDNYYGTYKPDLKNKITQGFIVAVNVDGIGLNFYKKEYGAVGIFIKPGSVDELRGRLQRRDPSMPLDELERRLQNAVQEMNNEEKFYDYIVYNHDGQLAAAVKQIEEILEREGYVPKI